MKKYVVKTHKNGTTELDASTIALLFSFSFINSDVKDASLSASFESVLCLISVLLN